jgi:hypothetical protein
MLSMTNLGAGSPKVGHCYPWYKMVFSQRGKIVKIAFRDGDNFVGSS